MRLKGTITEQNLLKAFAGESQARNRYTFFAQTAKEEGYEQIAAIFAETADQELAHARRFFDFLDEGGMVTIEAEYPAGRIGKTKENLYEAAEGELLEWSDLYSNFSTIAVDEGFKDVAAAFRAIARVEEFHEWRYRQLLSRIEEHEVFRREEPIKWQCRHCGYVHEGLSTRPRNAPPACTPKPISSPNATTTDSLRLLTAEGRPPRWETDPLLLGRKSRSKMPFNGQGRDRRWCK